MMLKVWQVDVQNEVSIIDPSPEDGRPVVLQVLPSLVTGGVERGTVDVARAIVAAGGTAIVASEGGPMEVELSRAGAEHVRLPLASKNIFVMRQNVSRLLRLIRARRVDVVHARSRAPAWSAYYAAKRSGAHFITTFHGTYNFSNEIKRRYNAIMTRGERVIAISEYIADHIQAHYKVDPARLRIVQRGIDLGKFDPERVSAERVVRLATGWRLPDGVPLVLMPGRLTRWKGQALLIEALALLGEREFICAIVGSDQGRGAYRAELEALIKAKGLTSRVFILDHCEDMPAAYKLSDAVVSASTDPEGFGRVISEAQAMGRPVVAAEHGGAREQVIPGQTAYLFEPGRTEALAAGLAWALDLGEAARWELAAAAIANVREKFSHELMCARTLALYRELTRGDDYARHLRAAAPQAG